jgi:hypothetical protein
MLSMFRFASIGIIVSAWLVTPHLFDVLGIPIGADALFAPGYGIDEMTVTAAYLSIDVALITATLVLWRRSFDFAPFRLIMLASVTMYLADTLYQARVAQESYEQAADIADFGYAIAITLLIGMLVAVDLSGWRQTRASRLAYERIRNMRHARGGAAGEAL